LFGRVYDRKRVVETGIFLKVGIDILCNLTYSTNTITSNLLIIILHRVMVFELALLIEVVTAVRTYLGYS
jgi:hypothetical protein